MREGDTVNITNGSGLLLKGRIRHLDPKACEVDPDEVTQAKAKNFSLHLAVSPVKNMARFEWFLEKSTEIGIDQITPLICKRSEKVHVRNDRLQKILVSSMKQSLNLFLPRLNEPLNFPDLIRDAKADSKYIAWCETSNEPLLSHVCPPGKDVIVLIGPEGDFNSEEVALAIKTGFLPISLGKNRLRTETAALAACFAVNFVNKTI